MVGGTVAKKSKIHSENQSADSTQTKCTINGIVSFVHLYFDYFDIPLHLLIFILMLSIGVCIYEWLLLLQGFSDVVYLADISKCLLFLWETKMDQNSKEDCLFIISLIKNVIQMSLCLSPNNFDECIKFNKVQCTLSINIYVLISCTSLLCQNQEIETKKHRKEYFI